MMSQPKELYIRAEAYRLILARASIDEAFQTSQLAIELNLTPQDKLYRPLHAAIVISYGRAFTEMKPLGRISSKWSKFDNDDDQKTHDILIKQRHQFVGHSDHIPNKVILYPAGAEMYGGDIAPRAQTEILSNYIDPARFTNILKLTDVLGIRMAAAISDTLEKIYGVEGENLNETIELISEADIAELRENNR